MLLRQSTAVVFQFGPFLDKTDGVTLETGLVSALDHASTGILASKNGGTLTIRHASVTASTYDAHGCYKVTLDTTDTNTLGSLRVIYTDAATCLPVWMDFLVVTANEWDSMCSTAIRAANATQFAGQTITAAAGVTLPTSVASPTNVTAATGVVLSNTGIDNILDRTAGVETSWTLRQAFRIILAVAAGKLSGAATTTVAIRDMADSKDRISATVDSDGNRSAVTRDAT